MKSKHLLTILFLFIASYCTAQLKIGDWQDHLPYYDCRHITIAKNKIYCATNVGLFSYNTHDNSLERLNKINGFSDIGISALKFNPTSDILFVAYENANIDILKNGQIYNFSNIKQKLIQGGKSINSILFIDDMAFLSCDFGVTTFNTTKMEFGDTYYIGENADRIKISQMAFDGQMLYAATESGIYMADHSNPNLIDYRYWQKIDIETRTNDSYVSIIHQNGQIYAFSPTYPGEFIRINFDGTYNAFQCNSKIKKLVASEEQLIVVNEFKVQLYDNNIEKINEIEKYGFNHAHPQDAVFDDSGKIWIADGVSGLVYEKNDAFGQILINGPRHYSVVDMSIENGQLWVAGGVKFQAAWRTYGAYSYINNFWTSYNGSNISGLQGVTNLATIAIDPANNDHVYIGSWGSGLLEFSAGQLINHFDDSNSPLRNIANFTEGYIRVSGMDFDSQNNLWLVTSEVSNPVYMIKPDGTWDNPDFRYNGFNETQVIYDLLITQYDHIWLILRDNGLFVFDSTGNERKFSVLGSENNFLTNSVTCAVEDLEGAVWIGTREGIVVYYSPESVFTGYGFYAVRPTINTENESHYLLLTENITAMAVDGANRKWIGTENSGVFLISADGSDEIYHFTAENYPLFSNNITSIAINNQNGEVFFGTDKGIISYRGNSTIGKDVFNDVYVFPNPVKPEYKGDVVIKGLVRNAIVKITDISGNLVYETTSLGGQALWNGKNFRGKRVNTGVYLVYCSTEDGSDTAITKLLFIN